jgi:2-polyprenyl-3-methyl-5-hydroxy-6-metoxy-1,4-benzoquinol methylase
MLTPQWDLYSSIAKRIAAGGVLEVGFGTGAGVLQYAHRANFVDALEIDPEAVKFAKLTWPVENVNWWQADIRTYDNDKRYTHAIAVEVLEHIPNWHIALDNIARLLLREGLFYMTARNANADLSRWTDLHERELTSVELVGHLREHFREVYLYDWSLQHLQPEDTHITPLTAICRQ